MNNKMNNKIKRKKEKKIKNPRRNDKIPILTGWRTSSSNDKLMRMGTNLFSSISLSFECCILFS